jgi:hypothetical protein
LWRTHWAEFTPFLAFPPDVRRVVSTTISLSRSTPGWRKVTRNRGQFPSDAVGGELGTGQHHAQDADGRGDVDILLGVDAEDDLLNVGAGVTSHIVVRQSGHRVFAPDRLGWRMAIAGPGGRSEL